MPALTPDILLRGYAEGIFPMANDEGIVEWFEANPRAILDVEAFRIPHEVRRAIRQQTFEIRFDTAFERVIRACAGRQDTWISQEIIAAYTQLHEAGHAHSVEAWHRDRLVGGLYGANLGAAFFGESMFYHTPGASKVALAHLCRHLRAQRFLLHDIQQLTPTLELFGAHLIPKSEYLTRLRGAILEFRSFMPR